MCGTINDLIPNPETYIWWKIAFRLLSPEYKHQSSKCNIRKAHATIYIYMWKSMVHQVRRLPCDLYASFLCDVISHMLLNYVDKFSYLQIHFPHQTKVPQGKDWYFALFLIISILSINCHGIRAQNTLFLQPACFHSLKQNITIIILNVFIWYKPGQLIKEAVLVSFS